jgi:hypothetical protein
MTGQEAKPPSPNCTGAVVTASSKPGPNGETVCFDPKDATIAAQQSLIAWHEKREAMLLEMLLTKIKAETQAMQDRLNELDKQKPVVPADPKAGEKK